MMRPIFSYLLVGLVVGSPVWAESPAERIRDLYQSVPYERVRASPQVDILAHIEVMRERRHSEEDGFAVPDLDMETVLRENDGDDVLMNPGVLEAIARMPPERAAQVLRMIEDRRSGLDPLQDVPALSLSEDPDAPESLSLRGWQLDRDASGAPFLQNGQDAASRIMLVPSMVLANFGRVLSIQDDDEGFRVTLESGDVLEGEVAQTTPAPDLAGAVQIAYAAVPGLSEGAETVRPKARPVPPDAGEVSASVSAVPPVSSLRPKPRPAGLGGET